MKLAKILKHCRVDKPDHFLPIGEEIGGLVVTIGKHQRRLDLRQDRDKLLHGLTKQRHLQPGAPAFDYRPQLGHQRGLW